MCYEANFADALKRASARIRGRDPNDEGDAARSIQSAYLEGLDAEGGANGRANG